MSPDLGRERVRFDIDAPGDPLMLVSDLLGAGDIQERISLAVELQNLLLWHAEASTVRIVTAKGPSIGKAMGLKNGTDRRDIAGGLWRQVVQPRVVDPAAGVLDVVWIKPEAAKCNKVMKELIGNACKRIPEEYPEHDDLSLAPSHCSTPMSGRGV
jgi:hypothetical protein